MESIDNRHIADKLRDIAKGFLSLEENTDKVSSSLFVAFYRVLTNMARYYDNDKIYMRDKLEEDLRLIERIVLMYEELSR